jgi:DNA-binding IclR family transcriptional regulator
VTGRSVTSRVFGVLDAFTDQRRLLTLSEISRRAGIPLATAHRLVGELVQWGALERDASGRYQIGLRLWEVASLAPRGPGLREAALPFLVDLHETTRQQVRLSVLDEGDGTAGVDVVDVECVPGRDVPGAPAWAAGRRPAHTTAAGLVLLAFAPATLQRRYLTQPPPAATSDARLLRGALAGVRQKGYAVGDRQAGAVQVAAPVRDPAGEVVAAVSVVVPAAHPQPAALAGGVVTASRGVSRRVRGLRLSG